MPDALFQLPLPVAGVLIIGVLCLYSVAGTALTRSFILPRLNVNGDDSEFTGAMVQAIMVFYGLAMALVAVSVWETHSEVSDTVSQEASRLRLDAMLIKLPGTLWFIILFGAAISLAPTFLFKVRDARLHFIQVTLLSVFVGLIITLIVAFDRPFHGDLGIDPEPYSLIRTQLMTP